MFKGTNPGREETRMYDLIIRGGTVVDGTGVNITSSSNASDGTSFSSASTNL